MVSEVIIALTDLTLTDLTLTDLNLTDLTPTDLTVTDLFASPPPYSGRWCNMDVAVKMLLFHDMSTPDAELLDDNGKSVADRAVAVREAA